MVSLSDMTEKRKPTYDLEGFKAAFASVDRLNVTGVALRNAAELGFGRLRSLRQSRRCGAAKEKDNG